MNRIERMLSKIALPIIGVALVLLVIMLVRLNQTSRSVEETSAYTRVSNCIVAKVAEPPTVQDEVEQCYVQVEKDTGVTLQRFDEQTGNE